MVMQFSSAVTTVQISGGQGVPIPNSTQTTKAAFLQGTGSLATLYTPTAGKTFYLMGLAVYGAISASVFKNDGTTEVARPTSSSGGSFSIAGSAPIETYTNAAPLKFNGTNTGYISAWGVEV